MTLTTAKAQPNRFGKKHTGLHVANNGDVRAFYQGREIGPKGDAAKLREAAELMDAYGVPASANVLRVVADSVEQGRRTIEAGGLVDTTPPPEIQRLHQMAEDLGIVWPVFEDKDAS